MKPIDKDLIGMIGRWQEMRLFNQIGIIKSSNSLDIKYDLWNKSVYSHDYSVFLLIRESLK